MWKSTISANWMSCVSMWKTASTAYKRRSDNMEKNLIKSIVADYAKFIHFLLLENVQHPCETDEHIL